MLDPEQSLGIGQPGRQGLPVPFEARLGGIINEAKSEGERPDPWIVYNKLSDLLSELTLDKAVTPEQQALQALATDVKQVREAFLIVAFHEMDESYQGIISRRIHGYISSGTIGLIRVKPFRDKSQESFTLTEIQKGILQRITAAAGIPDIPGQLTYSYRSIPSPTNVVQGSIAK